MKNKVYIEDTIDAIDAVMNSMDLSECADYLSDYAKRAYQEE